MKIQSINPLQYRNIYTKDAGLLNFGEEDQKIDKLKSNDYNYNKNIAGKGNEESETEEESDENQDKITSKIVVNSSGMENFVNAKKLKSFQFIEFRYDKLYA